MITKNLQLLGRIFYGIGLAGIGLMHFFFQGFRPVISAIQPDNSNSSSVIIYLFALYFILSGVLIALGKEVKITSLVLAYVLILFMVFGHLPKRLFDHLDPPLELASWTNFFKLSAFIGGALLIARSTNSKNTSSNFITKLAKLAPFGKHFFCIMLIVFGIDHFVYKDFVSGLVPKWIPFPVFWAYSTGIALMSAGISILANFKVRLVSQLLASMLFIWLITIHIVLSIRFPNWNNGGNLAGTFHCLAFTGIALIISGMETRSERSGISRTAEV